MTKYEYRRFNGYETDDGETVIEIPDEYAIVSLSAFGGVPSAKCLKPVDGESPENFLFEAGEGNAP